MTEERWRLEGSAPEAYERFLVPVIFEPWGARLVAAAGVGPRDRVVDVGSGTGAVARLAAARVGRAGSVSASDLSAGMVAVARTVSAHVRPPVDFRAADAQALPYPDGAVDVALCQFSVMFFVDRPAALAELRRVLAPGGRLALNAWRPLDHNPGWAALVAALEAHAGPAAATMMRAPFGFGDAPRLRALADGTGFTDVRVDVDAGRVRFPSARELVRRQAAGSQLSVHIGALDAAAREALVADLAERMRPYIGPDGIAFPAQAHRLVAHRSRP
jgi:SAM-dependent methyltransferase